MGACRWRRDWLSVQVHTHPIARELVEDALRSDQGNTPELQELARDLSLIT